ncbi:MAG: ABC transporter ATP-binding protein [Planctomycetota bacterium]
MKCLRELRWPIARSTELALALAERAGLHHVASTSIWEPIGCGREEVLAGLMRWVEASGFEAEPVALSLGELDRLLDSGPPLLHIVADGQSVLGISRCQGKRLEILTPGLERVVVSRDEVREALRPAPTEDADVGLETLLEGSGLSERRRRRALTALRDGLASHDVLSGVVLLRQSVTAPRAAIWRTSGLRRSASMLLVSQVLLIGVWVLSWGLLGEQVLEGRIDRGWLFAWGLLLCTLIVLRGCGVFASLALSWRLGTWLRRRLLRGVLKSEPSEIRHRGVGQWMGRLLETENLEASVSEGSLGTFQGLLELAAACLILSLGVTPGLPLAVLGCWALGTWQLWRRYAARRQVWSDERLAMTDDLVEKMIGHRTRAIQERPADWHTREDARFESYHRESRRIDRLSTLIEVFVARGWLAAGLCSLAPAFVFRSGSVVDWAISLGGVLLAYRAWGHLAGGLEALANARDAWRRVEPLWRAAARPVETGEPTMRWGSGETVLSAHEVSFAYDQAPEPVLAGASCRIAAGDRILLESASGSGKSTFAKLLNGSATPRSGLLLLQGGDRSTLGSEPWRRRVALSPQFHENHVLLESFAFNALLGRRWPPTEEDVMLLGELCEALGLGDLIDRMPSGLFQPIGETGWQLSHGEQSRLFILRALLQDADLLIVDEGFAALDPESMERALEVVKQRSKALMIIAHA